MVGDYRGSYRRSSDSKDSGDAYSVEEETTSSVYSGGKEYMSREWTNEKHSLYLKSMEASFVDQLYNSLSALGSNLNKENVPETGSSRKFHNSRKSSQEQKMNVKQPEYQRTHGGSHEFLKSPWIKHYKSLPKNQNAATNECSSETEHQVVSSNGNSGSASSHSRDRDQISNIGDEVCDQNFVNQGENGSSKKMKTVKSGSSSTDQVVPLGKAPAT